MAKYTTLVRTICEVSAGLTESTGFDDMDQVLTNSAPKVFNFDFPIFDEGYRLILEKNILRHYYMREIGMETVGVWKVFLADRLNLIMPYYNELYKSARLEFNPLYDTDYFETYKGTDKGENEENRNDTTTNTGTVQQATESTQEATLTSEKNGDNSNGRWDVFQDTPQSGLENVKDYKYLTNARNINDSGTYNDAQNDTTKQSNNETVTNTLDTQNALTGNKTGNFENVKDYVIHVSGKRGGQSYAKDILDFRKTLLRIDEMLVEELSDLFMNIY